MAIDIPDAFDEVPGQFTNYDTPYPYSTTFASNLTQILADQHIDVRTFDQNAVIRSRTQTDLDGLLQTTLDTQTQTQLEQVVTVAGEAWTVTGLTGASAFTFGKHTSRQNWKVGRTVSTGGTFTATLTSSIPINSGGGLDISAMDFLSFILPDFTTFNTTTSTIQLCSNPTGDFSSAISPAVPFSSSVGSTSEKKFAMSAFTTVDLTRVTGVKIILTSTGSVTAGTIISVMAMRAYETGYVPMTLEMNTKRGVVTGAPSFTGADPSSSERFVPMIRGVQAGTSDPRPIDGTLTLYFNTGNLEIAASPNYNLLQLFFRENQVLGTSGDYVVAQLGFRLNSTQLKSVKMVNGTSVSPAGDIVYSGAPALQPNTYYAWQADLTNNTLNMSIYLSDTNGTIGNKIWSSLAENSGANLQYARKQGRVGWYASLFDRDVEISNFTGSATAFSTVRTKVIPTYTPVDGAQLVAAFAEDTNLWNGWSGNDTYRDQTKTLSGIGSYSTSYPIFSDEFLVTDWNNTYISYDIWVPSQVSDSNQPYPVLRSNDTLLTVNLPKPSLQPNQWNSVFIDLSQLQGYLTTHYQVWIESGEGVETPYRWWIDNAFIGRRNVSWQMRANSFSPWREFRDAVNNSTSAVHLPPEERGTSLQLQAIGLTEDAWVSSYTLKPRYAELGRPIGY